MQPTALHCTSTLTEFICRIRGTRPPRSTILTLFSAAIRQHSETCVDGDVNILLTARLPRAALAARCTSVSLLDNRKSIGSRVSRPTSRTSEGCKFGRLASGSRLCSPRSVISANVKLADRCRSTLSEYTSVVRASNGGPEKKSVSARCAEWSAFCLGCCWVGIGRAYILEIACKEESVGTGWSWVDAYLAAPTQHLSLNPQALQRRWVSIIWSSGVW